MKTKNQKNCPTVLGGWGPCLAWLGPAWAPSTLAAGAPFPGFFLPLLFGLGFAWFCPWGWLGLGSALSWVWGWLFVRREGGIIGKMRAWLFLALIALHLVESQEYQGSHHGRWITKKKTMNKKSRVDEDSMKSYPIYPTHNPSSTGRPKYDIPESIYGPTFAQYGYFDRLPPTLPFMSSSSDPWMWEPQAPADDTYQEPSPFTNPFWSSQLPMCAFWFCTKKRCEQQCGVGQCTLDEQDRGYSCNDSGALTLRSAHAPESLRSQLFPGTAGSSGSNEIISTYDDPLSAPFMVSAGQLDDWSCTKNGCDHRRCDERCDVECVEPYPIKNGWFCPQPPPSYLFWG